MCALPSALTRRELMMSAPATEHWNHVVQPHRHVCQSGRSHHRTQNERKIEGMPSVVAPNFTAKQELGGAEGDRTPDLHNAIVALSQLSYGP